MISNQKGAWTASWIQIPVWIILLRLAPPGSCPPNALVAESISMYVHQILLQSVVFRCPMSLAITASHMELQTNTTHLLIVARDAAAAMTDPLRHISVATLCPQAQPPKPRLVQAMPNPAAAAWNPVAPRSPAAAVASPAPPYTAAQL